MLTAVDFGLGRHNRKQQEQASEETERWDVGEIDLREIRSLRYIPLITIQETSAESNTHTQKKSQREDYDLSDRVIHTRSHYNGGEITIICSITKLCAEAFRILSSEAFGTQQSSTQSLRLKHAASGG